MVTDLSGRDKTYIFEVFQENSNTRNQLSLYRSLFKGREDVFAIHWQKHSENRKGRRGGYHFQRYTTTACKTCKCRHLCTQSKVNGRAIDRSEFAGVIEANSQQVKGNPDYYRQRQQVTEHMFGTMKQKQRFTHSLLRCQRKVYNEKT